MAPKFNPPPKKQEGVNVYKTHKTTPRDWIASGHRVRVKSSNVIAIGYDRENKVLWVEFGSGSPTVTHYKYYGVHSSTAKSFFNAASMGKFVWYRLRDKYVYDGPFPGRMPDYVSEIEVEIDE